MINSRKRVTIISRESDTRTLDVAMLEAELKARGMEVRVLCKLLTKDSAVKAAGYLGHIARQEAAILRSDVVVLDTYCIPASMLPHRKGTQVIQMWHALGAVKKFGWQTVGREGGSSMRTAGLMRMHHGYDYVVCASDITAGYFCEAFRTDAGRIVKLGLPRIDYIKSVAGGERRADTAKRIFSKYPVLCHSEESQTCHPEERSDEGSSAAAEKKTILYAPTFRPGKPVDVQSLIDAIGEIAPGRYNIVVKLHPLYRGEDPSTRLGSLAQDDTSACHPEELQVCHPEELQVCHPEERSDEGSIVIYDDDIPTNDWLSVADIIISDYSSFVIESTLADKPLYLYTYDIDEYSKTTGLNVDLSAEPISPYVFRDAKSLAERMDRDCRRAAETGGDRDTDANAESDCAQEAQTGSGSGGQDVPGYDFGALRAFRDRYIDPEIPGMNGPGSGTDDASSIVSCTAALADFIESLM